VLTEGEAFTALGGTESQSKPMLLDLSGMGFIAYDLEKKVVRVLPKTQQFVNARSKKADFDNLVFECDLRPKKVEGKSAEEIAQDPRLKATQERFDLENAQNKAFSEFAKLDLKTLDLELRRSKNGANF